MVFFERQKHGVICISLSLTQVWVFVPAVLDGIEVTAGLGLNVCLHSLFAVLLLLSDGLVLLVSLHKLLANLIGVGKLASLQPWVSNDVWDRQSLMWVEVQHSCDQVLELLIKEAIWLAVGVSRPELLRAVRSDQLIVRILQVGHVERWMTGIQDEENDSEGEKINDLALIGLLGVDLGCHKAE